MFSITCRLEVENRVGVVTDLMSLMLLWARLSDLSEEVDEIKLRWEIALWDRSRSS